MPRIPDEELERIKREVSLVALARERGIELKAQGNDRAGRCIFHEGDDTPSLVISPAKNLFHCFACGAAGSVIDWFKLTEGLSTRGAIEAARARLGVFGEAFEGSPALAVAVDLDADDKTQLRQVMEFYEEGRRTSPQAKEYLTKRGVGSEELAAHFHVGFANRSLGLHIPPKQSAAGEVIRKRLQKIGVYRKETGMEHFRGCITIPMFDENGDVAGLYGRRVGQIHTRYEGLSPHLYLPGPKRGLWNAQALLESQEIVLGEAAFDMFAFWENGIRNVMATFGANHFSGELFEALVAHAVRKVLIAFDPDGPGDEGAEKVAERLLGAGVDCYRVRFPKGMDANDYARRIHPPERALALALASAEWMGKGRPPAHSTVVLSGDDERASAIAAEQLPPTAARPPAAEASAGAPAAHPHAPASPRATGRFAPAAPDRAAEEKTMFVQNVVPSGARDLSPGVTVAEMPPPTVVPAPGTSCLILDGIAAESLSDDEAVFLFEDRRYRLRGLKKLNGSAAKFNVMVSRDALVGSASSAIPGFFVDGFDLFLAKGRASFERQAAPEIGVKDEVIKRDLGRLLRAVEAIERQRTAKLLEPKSKTPTMSAEEHADGLELSSAPNYFERTIEHFDACGLVGEETNKLVLWIAAASRRLEHPLAVAIQSNSSAGKSALMDAVLSFLPEEECERYSALTGKALFYVPEERGLKHKVLAIAEEEGAEDATYALKSLQSEGKLTIGSTGKEPSTGRMVMHEYKVEGPAMIVMTTPRAQLDEELQNRCLVLTVDESPEQTARIHRMQRQRDTLAGLFAGEAREKIRHLQQNAQRLMRPLKVVNPYSEQLEFFASRLRMRRDHDKYLTLIRSIAFLKQYQRPVKTGVYNGKALEYVEVIKDDIALANRLLGEVLGNSLDDLPPQTRRFLELLDEMVTAGATKDGTARGEWWFFRKNAREFTGWSHSQVAVHLDRLVDLEYVVAHGGGNGRRFVYELLYEGKGQTGGRFLPGLVHVEKLVEPSENATTTETFRPEASTFRGASGQLPDSFRAPSGMTNDHVDGAFYPISGPNDEKTRIASEKKVSRSGASGTLDKTATEEPELVGAAASRFRGGRLGAADED